MDLCIKDPLQGKRVDKLFFMYINRQTLQATSWLRNEKKKKTVDKISQLQMLMSNLKQLNLFAFNEECSGYNLFFRTTIIFAWQCSNLSSTLFNLVLSGRLTQIKI